MENSRASSMAQLSAWTDAMKNVSKAKGEQMKQNFAEEDEYEEEFEDYEEEFEDEEPIEIAPPKTTLQKSEIYQSKPSESSFRAPREQEKKSTPVAKSSNDHKISVSRSIADPRTVRIQRILSSGVLNLQHERFTLYNSLPTPPYEYYIQSLRSLNSNIRQVGVPNDVDLCDMEVNTDDIQVSDKEVQHCYEDDLPFYDMLEKLKGGNFVKSKHNVKSESLQNESSKLSEDSDDENDMKVNKLSHFLEKSMAIFEDISRKSSARAEANEYKSSKEDNSRINSLIDKKFDWINFGKDYKHGLNELLRTRTNQCVVFSSLQPHMFVVSHPPPVGADTEVDLRPLKALYSVWDVNKAECPHILLESTGTPSVCCFSSTQTFIIVAGTTEGIIHLWDLRESSSFHRDKDSEDLKIAKGIRKPTFSTHLSAGQLVGANLASNTLDDESLYCHSGCILSIDSLDSNDADIKNSTSSQFVSLDEFGTVMFWVTNEVFSVSSIDDNLRQSPWGRTILLPTKCIPTQSLPFLHQVKIKSNKQVGDFLKLRHHTLVTIPGDSSSFLLTGMNGELNRISRTGQTSLPFVYSRNSIHNNSPINVDVSTSIQSYENIIIVAPRQPFTFLQKPTVDIAQLFLVGREDGTLDLFQLDNNQPIHSWVLTSVKEGGANSKPTNSIVCIKWLQFAKSAFMVIDSSGMLFYFDLLYDFYHPIFADSIEPRTSELLMKGAIDLARLNSTLDSYRVASVHNSSKGGHHSGSVNLRCLNSAPSMSKKYTDQDELRLQEKLLSIATSVVKSTCITLSSTKK